MKRSLLFAIFAAMQISLVAQTKLPDTYAFSRGVESFQQGKSQDALDWFNKEVNDHPDDGYAFIYISTLRYSNNEYGKALTAINQALKKLPKKDKEYAAIAHATRASIYLVMEDTISAIHDYDAAIKLEPAKTTYYNSRAQIYFEQNHYDLADADYNQMINIDPGNVMGYMGIGRNARERKDYDAAIEKFNYVIKLEPDYSSGYSFRAECYIAQKKYTEAIDDLIKALSLDNDQKAYYHIVSMDKEAFPILKAKLQVQANLNPNEAEWPYYLGLILENSNRQYEAVKYYEQAQSRDANSLFLERIAHCFFDLGNYEMALSYINRAINMDSSDDDLILMKGNIYNEMGDYKSAIAELDKYITNNPDEYFGYYRRGWFKDEANDINGAIDDYTMSITLEPRYAYAYCGRGRFYYDQGKKDLAEADFKKVIELDTVPESNSCAHYAYYYLGQREKAVEFVDSIIASEDDNPGNYYDAACLYSIMQEPDTAVKYLEKAFELGYRRMAHIKADHDLDNVRELPAFKSLIEKYTEQLNRDIQEQEQAAPDADTQVEKVVEVPFTKENGVTKVKCAINDLPLHFVFDTGAAEVTMSMVEANFMLKNDYITSNDIIGSARYVDANGDISEGTVVNLRKVNFGGLELDNVRASVVRNQKAPLLLGQSVLGRLGKIEIDNSAQTIKITSYKK